MQEHEHHRDDCDVRHEVGTATDAHTMLRIIFSRLGTPYAGTSTAFSFNSPEGMCPTCEGLGRVSDVDLDELVDRDRSLNDGAITVPNFHPGSWYWSSLAHSGLVDPADIIPPSATGNLRNINIQAGPNTIDFHLTKPARK